MRALLLALVGIIACGGTTATDDAGSDGSFVDAKKDTAVPDASTDAPDDSPDGNTCNPDLPNGYAPTWIPPSTPSGACTTTQIQNLYDACHGPSQSSSKCNAFSSVPANATCEACMQTPIASSTYGPTIAWHNGDSLDANVGGCMALIDGDLSANGCGAKYEAWLSCQIAACSYCPEGTYVSCAVPAQSGACGAYEAAAKQCASDPKYSTCTSQPTFEAYFTTLGAMFCVAD
jgi:hypothetical protein